MTRKVNIYFLFVIALICLPANAQTFSQWQKSAEYDSYDSNSPAAMLVAGVFEGIWWASLRPLNSNLPSATGVCVYENSSVLPSVMARVIAVTEEGPKNPALPIAAVALNVMRAWYPCYSY